MVSRCTVRAAGRRLERSSERIPALGRQGCTSRGHVAVARRSRGEATQRGLIKKRGTLEHADPSSKEEHDDDEK